MHEASVVQALLDRIEEGAAAYGPARVTGIDVQLGELSGVEALLLQSAWEILCGGTRCEGAELRLRPIAARWQCPRCDAEIARGQVLRCASCQVPARLVAGDELILERFELDVVDLPTGAA